MRGGEIALAAGVEEVLYAVGVDEEGVAAGAAANVMSPVVATFGLRSERDLDVGEDRNANRLGGTRLFTVGHVQR